MSGQDEIGTSGAGTVDASGGVTVPALLAEYETIRAESLASIGHRLTVMNFTFGALSVVVAALLTRQVSDVAAGVIGLLFVPQMAKAGLLIWMGEYYRSQRAGRWLVGLEGRINEAVGEDVLGWEGSLVQTGRHMAYPYQATVVFILGTGYAGAGLGAYFIGSALNSHLSWPLVGGASLLIVGIAVSAEILFLVFFRTKWRESRSDQP